MGPDASGVQVISGLYSDDSLKLSSTWAGVVRAVRAFAKLSVVTGIGVQARKSLVTVTTPGAVEDQPDEGFPGGVDVVAWDRDLMRSVEAQVPVRVDLMLLGPREC